jgi:hypothetical protein
MSQLARHVSELTGLIEKNQTIEAMIRFYADDVIMQENDEPARNGKVVCLDHEQRTLTRVTGLKAVLLSQAINEEAGIVFSEWYLESTSLSGQRYALTEVSVQRWRNELIYQEKFYYKTIHRLDSV